MLNLKSTLFENDIIGWCAVILDDESVLKLKTIFKKFYPKNWTVKTHHMTIDPFNIISDDKLLNQSVTLMVTHIGISDRALAVKVVGYKGKTNNNFPHITLAVDEIHGGQSSDSNLITKWSPLYKNIILTGKTQNILYKK